MEKCRNLIKLINESVSDLTAVLREDSAALEQPVATLERLIAALDSNNLDYVLCALERRQTRPQRLRVVQGDVELRIGASAGYAMEDVANEYRSGRRPLDAVLARITEAAREIPREAVEGGEDVVLEAQPRFLHEQSVSVPFAFVELVLDEYRSFTGAVVCVTLRTESQFFVVDASQEFSVHVEAPVFHCWKCLVNFRGTFSATQAALLCEGAHSAVPCTHSSACDANAEGPFCDVEGSVVNIRAGVSKRTLGFRPLEPWRIQLGIAAPPHEQRELLELRHFVARSNDRSLDCVMTDRQLCRAAESRCLSGRMSPLVRAYIGDFLRILPRSGSRADDVPKFPRGAMKLDVDVSGPRA